MKAYELVKAFNDGHRLVNDSLGAEMQKGEFLHIFAEMNMYVNLMRTATEDIVEVGPSDFCLCMSLSADNWKIEDQEVSE